MEAWRKSEISPWFGHDTTSNQRKQTCLAERIEFRLWPEYFTAGLRVSSAPGFSPCAREALRSDELFQQLVASCGNSLKTALGERCDTTDRKSTRLNSSHIPLSR